MEIKKHFNTFSEAIREGAKLRPQCAKRFFDDGKTCAVGAGTEAVFGLPLPHYSEVYRAYPYIDALGMSGCPACNGPGTSLASVIFHLNDDHKWSREDIADWLESEEEKLGYVLLTEEPQTCNTKDSAHSPEPAGVFH